MIVGWGPSQARSNLTVPNTCLNGGAPRHWVERPAKSADGITGAMSPGLIIRCSGPVPDACPSQGALRKEICSSVQFVTAVSGIAK